MLKTEEVDSPRKRKAAKLRMRLRSAAREPNTKKWLLAHARRYKEANDVKQWTPNLGLQPNFR